MADKKVSELDTITGADTASDDFFLIVDTSGSVSKKISRAELTESIEIGLNEIETDLSFGDNIKAKFGASDDLQIYHDGSHSYIQDAGTGEFRIKTNGNIIQFLDGSNNYLIRAAVAADVGLYYNTAQKLATTNTGIDVTGTVVSDGQLVVGAYQQKALDGNANGFNISIDSGTDVVSLYNYYNAALAFGVNNTNSMYLTSTGLGIGTSSPVTQFENLTANGTLQTRTKVTGSTASDIAELGISTGTRTYLIQSKGSSGDFVIRDSTGAADRITMDTSGNVGIGKTSSYARLEVSDGTGTTPSETQAGATVALFQNNDSTTEDAHIAIIAGTSGQSRVFFGDADDENPGVIEYDHGSNFMAFRTNGSGEDMRIDASGDVAIGTTTATYRLTVEDSSADWASRIYNTGTGASNQGLLVRTDSTTANNASAFAVYGDGAYRLMVKSGGNVGIGSSAPVGLLDLDGGSSAFTIQLKETSGAYQRMGFQKSNDLLQMGEFNNDGSVFTPILNVSGNGDKVGIGTSSVDTLLHLAGADTAVIRLENTDTSLTTDQLIGGVEFEKQDPSGAGAGVVGGVRMYSYDSVGSSTYLKFSNATSSSNDAEAMRIDQNLNVGIGETSPSYKLTVKGDAAIQQGSLSLRVGADTGGTTVTNATQKVGRIATPHYTNAEEPMAMIMGSAGNGYNDLYVGGGSSLMNTASVIRFYTAANSTTVSGSERIRIDSNGTLIINDTARILACLQHITFDGSAEQGLCVENTANNSSGAAIRFIDYNANYTGGGIYFSDSNSITYATTSDYRLKENVVELTGATERLKQIPVYRFNFNTTPEKTVDGMFAHEVSDVVPEAIIGEKDAVDADGNPEYQGIDQSKLVPLLIATIKELEARITALES